MKNRVQTVALSFFVMLFSIVFMVSVLQSQQTPAVRTMLKLLIRQPEMIIFTRLVHQALQRGLG